MLLIRKIILFAMLCCFYCPVGYSAPIDVQAELVASDMSPDTMHTIYQNKNVVYVIFRTLPNGHVLKDIPVDIAIRRVMNNVHDPYKQIQVYCIGDKVKRENYVDKFLRKQVTFVDYDRDLVVYQTRTGFSIR